jgi:hypothetical protein
MPWRFTKYRPGPDTRWPTGPAQPLLRLARARASTGCISDVRLSAGDGTDGSNPICSSGESVANRFPRWVQRPLILPRISTASCRAGMPTRRPGGIKASVTQLIQELIPEGRQRAEEHQRGQASGSGVRGRAPGRLAGQLFFGVRRAVEVTESVAAPLLRAGYAQFEAGPQWPLGWRDSDGWVLPLCGRCLEPVAGSRRFGEAVHSFPCHLLWGPSNGRNRRRD